MPPTSRQPTTQRIHTPESRFTLARGLRQCRTPSAQRTQLHRVAARLVQLQPRYGGRLVERHVRNETDP